MCVCVFVYTHKYVYYAQHFFVVSSKHLSDKNIIPPIFTTSTCILAISLFTWYIERMHNTQPSDYRITHTVLFGSSLCLVCILLFCVNKLLLKMK